MSLEFARETRLFPVITALLLGAAASPALARSGRYLVVAAPPFSGSAPLNEFVAYRTAQGFETTVYVPPAGATNETIRSYIQSWYDPAQRSFLLIVGDSTGPVPVAGANIPDWNGGGFMAPRTDLPYACMDGGDDWYPDMFFGRFPIDTVAELQELVNKTLIVESGDYPSPGYVKRAAFVANTEESVVAGEATHNWVMEHYTTPAGFTSTPVYARLGAGTADVLAAINAGTLLMVYLGHSGFSGWWEPQFYSSSIPSLTNNNLYGLIVGLTCGSARFDWDYGECFGELLLRTPNKGAAAYIGATTEIHSGPYSQWESVRRLEKYMFQHFIQDGIWEVGPAWQATVYSLLADPDYGPTHPHTRDYFEMFVLIGDPALLLPHDLPATGDFDEDGDVDLHDFANFQTCFGQSATMTCHAGDFSDSDQIGPPDFELLPEALTGPQ